MHFVSHQPTTSHLHPSPTHDTLVYSTLNSIAPYFYSHLKGSFACNRLLLHKSTPFRLYCWGPLSLSTFIIPLHRIITRLSLIALHMFRSMIMSLMKCLFTIASWCHNYSLAFLYLVGKITLGKSFFPSHESIQYIQLIDLFLLQFFFVDGSFVYFRTVNYLHINFPHLLKLSFICF